MNSMRSITPSKRITIGVLPGWQLYAGEIDSFLGQVLEGILAACEKLDVNVLVACGVGDVRQFGLGRPAWPLVHQEMDFVPVGPWNTDGLIVIPPLAHQIARDYIQTLLDQGFPLLYAGDRDSGPGVFVDNDGGIQEALQHLVLHGHRQIAFVAGREHSIHGDSGIRRRAFLACMAHLGLKPNPELIAFGSHTYEGGRFAIQTILDRKVPFTALLASNDESAIGVMDELHNQGVNIPEDVALIGFDDRLQSRAQQPPLTTVHYPMYELGTIAVEQLLRRIRGEVIPNDMEIIPVRLVVRESCGCFPGMALASPLSQQVLAKKSMQAVLAEMSVSVTNETYRLTFKQVMDYTQQLLSSFQTSLLQGDPAGFRETLGQILNTYIDIGDDVYAWQGALTILHNNLNIFLGKRQGTGVADVGVYNLQIPPLTEIEVSAFLHQARVAISQAARGQSTRQLLRSSQIADQLSVMTSQFLTAKSEEEIFSLMQAGLPQIGIQHSGLGIYQPGGHDPYQSYLLKTPDLACRHDKEAITVFPTYEFPPPGLFNENKSYQANLVPFGIDEMMRGFLILDTGNQDVVSDVTRLVEAALRGVYLFEEAILARSQAEEANRLKSRFLSMVSHELRTPLNLISGLSDILLKGYAGQVEKTTEQKSNQQRMSMREDLERIYLSSQHLDGLIRDVLDLAGSDFGQLRLTCEPLNLIEVLTAVAGIGMSLSQDKGLTWRMDMPDHLGTVWGDRTRLRQVFLNLINNAIKFTSQGEICLTAQIMDGQVAITIRDTGLGIPLDDQEIIFDEFRQSERSSVRGFGGLGLGLAICKRIVDLHRGKIQVYSTGAEGEGSSFTVLLPSMPVPGLDNRKDAERSPRVFVISQDEINNDIIYSHLETQGYQVELLRVANNLDCLTTLAVGELDAIILDLPLATKHGWEILKTLKESPRTQDLPVLFVNLDGSQDQGSLLSLDYLGKPLKTAELAQALLVNGLLGNEDSQVKKGKSILIVDDDPGILELHTRILQNQSQDYKIQQAKDGREALEFIQQQPPDLVLLDLMMPEIDGFQVLEKLRDEERTRNIPVIVVTGQSLTQEEMTRLNCGVASVLSKGMFTVAETLHHISEVLENHRRMGSETQRLVLRAMAYIHVHFHETIARKDIADYVGLSERHLTRCFHQEVGITPISYLNRYRVWQARQLLERGDKGITEIALDVGFSSSGYFTRVFREEVGISPSVYKRKRLD